MHIILMGAQGAGKGTQANRIAPLFKLVHISTGDVFRAAIANGTNVGLLAKQYLDRGELVPDEVTVAIVDEKLGEVSARPNDVGGTLLDGFPRNAAQAEGLDRALKARGDSIDSVIEISVPRPELEARLAGRRVCPNCGATFHLTFHPPKQPGKCDVCSADLVQRKDDTPEAIRRRLDIYFEQTEPLLAYYEARGLLHRVDGNRLIDEVTAGIAAAIGESAGDR